MYCFVLYSCQLSCLVHINDEWISGVLSANRNLSGSAQYIVHTCTGYFAHVSGGKVLW